MCGAEVEYRFAGSRDHLLRVTFLTFRDVVERALRRDPVPEIHAECRAQFTRRDVIGSGEVWNGHPSRNTIHVAVLGGFVHIVDTVLKANDAPCDERGANDHDGNNDECPQAA